MSMVPPLVLRRSRGYQPTDTLPPQSPPQSISGIIPYGQASEDDPYVPRDIYYDVNAGRYREVKHEQPPPDAVPFYRVGYAEPVSWRDSEGNRYEPPDYETPLFAPADWQKEESA